MPSMDFADLIPLTKVPELLPPTKSGKRLHFSAVHRWATEGIRGVRLRVTCVGRAMHTTPAWLSEFMQRIAEARGLAACEPAAEPGDDAADAPAATVRTPARRQREAARAEAACEQAGY